MLLVCVNRGNVAHDAIAGNGRFIVNVLAAHQQRLAAAFAGSTTDGPAYDFNSGDWSVTASGIPRLTAPAAVFECELESSTKAGTHSIFLGRVVEAQGRKAAPLAYANREYGVPMPLAISDGTNSGTESVLAAIWV